MRRNISAKIILCYSFVFLLLASRVEAKRHILYVGTYTKGVTEGIFVYSFNDRMRKLVY